MWDLVDTWTDSWPCSGWSFDSFVHNPSQTVDAAAAEVAWVTGVAAGRIALRFHAGEAMAGLEVPATCSGLQSSHKKVLRGERNRR